MQNSDHFKIYEELELLDWIACSNSAPFCLLVIWLICLGWLAWFFSHYSEDDKILFHDMIQTDYLQRGRAAVSRFLCSSAEQLVRYWNCIKPDEMGPTTPATTSATTLATTPTTTSRGVVADCLISGRVHSSKTQLKNINWLCPLHPN